MADPTGETERSALRLDFDHHPQFEVSIAFCSRRRRSAVAKAGEKRDARRISAGIWRTRVQTDRKSGNVGSKQACAARDERLLAGMLLMRGAAAITTNRRETY